MADTKISALPAQTTLGDTDELVLAVAGANKKITGANHEAMHMLQASAWKGNIRELDNAIQRAVILGDGPLITPADLPPDLASRPDDPSAVDELNRAVERFEKLHIERVLRQAADKREAARRLDIGVSSLYRKIEQYGIGIKADDE